MNKSAVREKKSKRKIDFEEETESNIGKDKEEEEESSEGEGEGEGAEDSPDNNSDPCRRPSPRICEEDDDKDNPIAATFISGIGSDRKTGIDSTPTVCPAASLSHAEQTHFAKLSGSFGARMLKKIRKAKKKEREVKEKKAEAWRKPGKASTKIQYKTYEEIYSLRPIIDATGAVESKLLEERKKLVVQEDLRLRKRIEDEAEFFYRQTSEFEPELDRYRLDEVVVGAITPVVLTTTTPSVPGAPVQSSLHWIYFRNVPWLTSLPASQYPHVHSLGSNLLVWLTMKLGDGDCGAAGENRRDRFNEFS
ncbi:hypothetical protein GG344DRAFT_65024 [Lentinula edodes]|nr:hypothetical protein GG344DRAFT_65024 [Lentinula edodes]